MTSPRRAIRIHTGDGGSAAAETFTPSNRRTILTARDQRSPSLQLLTPHSQQNALLSASNPTTPLRGQEHDSTGQRPPLKPGLSNSSHLTDSSPVIGATSTTSRQPSYSRGMGVQTGNGENDTPSLNAQHSIGERHALLVDAVPDGTPPFNAALLSTPQTSPIHSNSAPTSAVGSSTRQNLLRDSPPSPQTSALTINLHAARLNNAPKLPASPPRMFVHDPRTGVTVEGRSNEYEKVLAVAETGNAERKRQSLSLNDPVSSVYSGAPRAGLLYTRVAEQLGGSPRASDGQKSFASSPSVVPIDTPGAAAATGSRGPLSTDWDTVHERNNGNGLKRSPSNARTAIQFDVRAGGASGAAGSVNVLLPDHTPTLRAAPSSTLTRQASMLTLEQDAAQSYAKHSLFFHSLSVECEYRYTLLSGAGELRAGQDSHRFFWALGIVLVMYFATLSPDVWSYHDHPGAFQARLTLASVGGALFLCIFLVARFKKAYQQFISPSGHQSPRITYTSQNSITSAAQYSAATQAAAAAQAAKGYSGAERVSRFLSLQPILAVLFCAAGCCWSAASVMRSDSIQAATASVPTILFLLIGFLMLDVFLFAHLFISSWVITFVYIIVVGFERSPNELVITTVSKMLFVSTANVILCYQAYHQELALRMAFLKSKHLVTTKHALQKETAELRNEVFSLVLEKFDIVDVTKDSDSNSPGSNLDLSSPLERSMKLLQELERDKNLSKKHFDKIRTIIEQLGSSNDNIFRPRMSQIVGSANARSGGFFKNSRANASLQRRGTTGSALQPSPTSSGSGGVTVFDRMRNGTGANEALMASSAASAGGGTSSLGGANGARFQLDEDTTKWLSGLVDDYPSDSSIRGAEDGLLEMTRKANSPSHAANLLSSEEEQTIHVLTEQLTDWNFDVFEVCKLTKNRPLFFIGLVLFRKNDLINKFAIDRAVLCNFLNTIENGYVNDLPYHNSTHAADVTRSMHFFLHKGGLNKDLNDLEILACLISSLMHDYEHPGVNNNFLMKTQHEWAMLYNDQSSLENHHLFAAFRELSKPETNILANLPQASYETLRKLIIQMVLATDLGQHFEIVGHFKNALPRLLTSADRATDAGKLMILKMALKCSDIAHSAKAIDLHTKWSLRIIEEFFRQGDKELALGLSVSPFMDRRVPNISKAQIGFIDFLAIPMFTLWTEYLALPEEVIPCLNQLKANKDYWAKRERAIDTPPPPPA